MPCLATASANACFGLTMVRISQPMPNALLSCGNSSSVIRMEGAWHPSSNITSSIIPSTLTMPLIATRAISNFGSFALQTVVVSSESSMLYSARCVQLAVSRWLSFKHLAMKLKTLFANEERQGISFRELRSPPMPLKTRRYTPPMVISFLRAANSKDEAIFSSSILKE